MNSAKSLKLVLVDAEGEFYRVVRDGTPSRPLTPTATYDRLIKEGCSLEEILDLIFAAS